jgi:hypothetical protein
MLNKALHDEPSLMIDHSMTPKHQLSLQLEPTQMTSTLSITSDKQTTPKKQFMEDISHPIMNIMKMETLIEDFNSEEHNNKDKLNELLGC